MPLLREGQVDFHGRYYRAEDCELLPRGPRPNGLPVWIAAFGPRMLGLTARWADGFITAWHTDPRALEAPFAALDAACAAIGRDPASLSRCVGTFVSFDESDQSAAQIADRLQSLHAAGATHLTCMLAPANWHGVERFARVIEQL